MRTDYALLSISTIFATMIYFANTISQKKNFKSLILKHFYRVLYSILGKKKCPICLEFARCYSVENCKHHVCTKCFENYLDDKLKNITEYPLKCHEYNCKELLHTKDIDYYVKNSPVNTREEKLKTYNKFSKLYLVPANLRIVCSQCDHVMSKAMFEKYYNTIFNNNTQNTNVVNGNNDNTTNTNNNTDNNNNSNNDNNNSNNDNNNNNENANNVNDNANANNDIDNNNSENNESQLNLSARWNHSKCEDCDETFSLLKDANNCRYCGKLFCPGCIHDNSVCYDCNLSIFSLSCKNCNALLCIECEQLWHKNDSSSSTNSISNINPDNNTNTNNNIENNNVVDNNAVNNNIVDNNNVVNNNAVNNVVDNTVVDNNVVNNNAVDNNNVVNNNVVDNNVNNVNAQPTDNTNKNEKKKKMKIDDSHVCNSILNKNKEDIETKELIKSLLYCYCPGCSMIIEKIDGCNHVTHVYCSTPKCVSDDDPHDIIVSGDGNTHFCYCCGDLISPNYMDTEHTTHFPLGSSEPCRKLV